MSSIRIRKFNWATGLVIPIVLIAVSQIVGAAANQIWPPAPTALATYVAEVRIVRIPDEIVEALAESAAVNMNLKAAIERADPENEDVKRLTDILPQTSNLVDVFQGFKLFWGVNIVTTDITMTSHSTTPVEGIQISIGRVDYPLKTIIPTGYVTDDDRNSIKLEISEESPSNTLNVSNLPPLRSNTSMNLIQHSIVRSVIPLDPEKFIPVLTSTSGSIREATDSQELEPRPWVVWLKWTLFGGGLIWLGRGLWKIRDYTLEFRVNFRPPSDLPEKKIDGVEDNTEIEEGTSSSYMANEGSQTGESYAFAELQLTNNTIRIRRTGQEGKFELEILDSVGNLLASRVLSEASLLAGNYNMSGGYKITGASGGQRELEAQTVRIEFIRDDQFLELLNQAKKTKPAL